MPAPLPVSEHQAELDQFLRSVQRRALVAARLAVPADDALDCVQSAMLKFIRAYRNQQPELWRPLFFRVLYNSLRDWQRRRVVREAFSWITGAEDELSADTPQPDRWLACSDAGECLIKELKQLPLRQQQVFIMRHWEGLDTAATATALHVSPGTVKTHLSRAIERLRKAMEEHYEPAA